MSFQSNKIDSQTLFLGVDGGGSKCRAKLISSDGNIVGTGISGRANPVHGIDRTKQSILESTRLAILNAGLAENSINEIHAGIGLAGVNLPGLYDKVAEWRHPFKSMHLTTDLHIACLGAHGVKDGGVIITGTGSCGLSIKEGKQTIYGAHGFPLGDQCSGAWIGLKAINAALLAFDQLGPETQLLETLTDFLNVEALEIPELMLSQPPKVFARLAPLVFELATQEDGPAQSIIREGADYVDRVATTILGSGCRNLCIIGGLRARIKPWLDPAIQEKLIEPLNDPEDGALLFVESQIYNLNSEAC